jgi:hypothetical protein
MLKKINLFMFMFLIVSAVVNTKGLVAQSYQFEANGAYSYEKQKDGNLSMYLLGVEAFFEQINLEGRPYAEAAFLQKTGSAAIIAMKGSSKFDSEGGIGESETDYVFFGGTVGYVIPVVPVFIKGEYSRNSSDGTYTEPGFKVTYDIKHETFAGDLGYYIIDGFILAGRYEKINETQKMQSSPDVKSEMKAFGPYFKYVTMFDGEKGLNIEGGFKRLSSKEEGEKELNNRIFSIEGDFYVTPQVSIGCSVEINRGDIKTLAGNTYGVELAGFINPNIGLGLEFNYFKADNSDANDSKEFSFSITGRI